MSSGPLVVSPYFGGKLAYLVEVGLLIIQP